MTEQQKQPTTATSTFPDKGDSTPQQQETLTPKADKTRKYRILRAGEYISRCGYILPNACQCWKAGEEEVTEKDAEGVEKKYQLCERHVRIQRAIDAGTLARESVSTVLQEQLANPPEVPREEEKPPAKEEKKKEEERPDYHFSKDKEQEETRKNTGETKEQPQVGGTHAVPTTAAHPQPAAGSTKTGEAAGGTQNPASGRKS